MTHRGLAELGTAIAVATAFDAASGRRVLPHPKPELPDDSGKSLTTPRGKEDAIMKLTGNLSQRPVHYEPPPQDNGLLPNEGPNRASPVASTLIYGNEDAVLAGGEADG